MAQLSSFIAVLRILVFLIWTLLLLPVQVCAVLFRSRISWHIPRLYHRGNCFILGLKVMIHGVPNTGRSVLFVSNHSSYLDIIVLASLLQACFISKSEVAAWPLFGILAKLNHTVFVQRKVVESSKKLVEVKSRLASGQCLVLFPEGTSNDGNRVLRFNSTFFGAAEMGGSGCPVSIQPIAIAYTRLWGLPLGRGGRPTRAWYGDMSLATHLWSLFKSGPTEVEVAFLPTVTFSTFGSRKDLAKACEQRVAFAVSGILGGQFSAEPESPG